MKVKKDTKTDYEIGGVVSLITKDGKVKKKSDVALASLFSVSSPETTTWQLTPVPVVVSQEETTAAVKKKKKKQKLVESELKNKLSTISTKASGFSPPPGILHESLIQDEREKIKTRLEEREEVLAEEVQLKKKSKKKAADSDDEDDIPKRRKKIKPTPEEKRRTVFVGNLPENYSKKEIKKLFRKYGEIETVRIRGVIPANPSLPIKAAVIKHEFHPQCQKVNAYVKFKEEKSAKKALKRNAKEIEGHHIIVDIVDGANEHDNKLSVFVGNLPFDVKEDDVWNKFEDCGDVVGVRLVRDSKTGIGKGFGYVKFKDSATVGLALQLDGTKLNEGRKLRVMRAVKKTKVKPQKEEKKPQKKNRVKDDKKAGKKGVKVQKDVTSRKRFTRPSNRTSATGDQSKSTKKKKTTKKDNALNALSRLKKKRPSKDMNFKGKSKRKS